MKRYLYEECWLHLGVFNLEMCNAMRVRGWSKKFYSPEEEETDLDFRRIEKYITSVYWQNGFLKWSVYKIMLF